MQKCRGKIEMAIGGVYRHTVDRSASRVMCVCVRSAHDKSVVEYLPRMIVFGSGVQCRKYY